MKNNFQSPDLQHYQTRTDPNPDPQLVNDIYGMDKVACCMIRSAACEATARTDEWTFPFGMMGMAEASRRSQSTNQSLIFNYRSHLIVKYRLVGWTTDTGHNK